MAALITTSMTKLETDILSELIASKRETLRQLRDLGIQQQGSVESGDTDLLFRVLAAKQRLLGDLQQTEQCLAPFREQDPEQRTWRSGNERQKCATQADECTQLLADVIRQERESEQALVERRDDAAEKLRAVHSAMHLQQSYGATGQAAPRSLDLTCGE
jgi:flagellar biosynthesis/type III secretory pathway chaperone